MSWFTALCKDQRSNRVHRLPWLYIHFPLIILPHNITETSQLGNTPARWFRSAARGTTLLRTLVGFIQLLRTARRARNIRIAISTRAFHTAKQHSVARNEVSAAGRIQHWPHAMRLTITLNNPVTTVVLSRGTSASPIAVGPLVNQQHTHIHTRTCGPPLRRDSRRLPPSCCQIEFTPNNSSCCWPDRLRHSLTEQRLTKLLGSLVLPTGVTFIF